MEFLEDASLVCCTALCCLSVVGVGMVVTFVRRTGNFVDDSRRKGREKYKSLLDFDMNDIIGRFLK